MLLITEPQCVNVSVKLKIIEIIKYILYMMTCLFRAPCCVLRKIDHYNCSQIASSPVANLFTQSRPRCKMRLQDNPHSFKRSHKTIVIHKLTQLTFICWFHSVSLIFLVAAHITSSNMSTSTSCNVSPGTPQRSVLHHYSSYVRRWYVLFFNVSYSTFCGRVCIAPLYH